jgi:hypothetical protein
LIFLKEGERYVGVGQDFFANPQDKLKQKSSADN